MSLSNPTKTEAKKGPRPPSGSWLTNAWRGLESIPGGFIDEARKFQTAARSDADTGSGIWGAILTPGRKVNEALGWQPPPSKRKKNDPSLDKFFRELVEGTYSAIDLASGGAGRKWYQQPTKKSLTEAGHFWHDNPVGAVGAVLTVVPGAGRVLGLSKLATKIKVANPALEMSRADATRAALVESYHPGFLADQGIEGGFAPRISGRRVSRNPVGRAGQRAFDNASENIDAGIGFGRLKTGPDTPFSASRRQAAGERRMSDLADDRLIGQAMSHVKSYAAYINDSLFRTATGLNPLNRIPGFNRMDTVLARDAAVGAALHAPNGVDPVEAVRLVADDADAQLQSGVRVASNGDLSHVSPEDPLRRIGQKVYVRLEAGAERVAGIVTAIDGPGDRATVEVEGTPYLVKNANAKLHADPANPSSENVQKLAAHEEQMLTKRRDALRQALAELEADPDLAAKFTRAVDDITQLGMKSEQLGVNYYLEKLHKRLENPKLSERKKQDIHQEIARIRMGLDDRRNMFSHVFEGALGALGPVDLTQGLWKEMHDAMAQTDLTREQQQAWGQVMQRQARLWALEREGRNPNDYLSSPEGANLGGIDFTEAEAIDRSLALLQEEGIRRDLVSSGGSGMDPAGWKIRVGDEVSTPEGIGAVSGEFYDSEQGLMHEVALYPQSSREHGKVGVFPDAQVHYIPPPDSPMFHLASERALINPKFPQKATAQQYEKALMEGWTDSTGRRHKGASKEEMYWLKIDEFLASAGEKSFPVESLRKHIAAQAENMKLRETVFTKGSGNYRTQWDSYSNGGLMNKDAEDGAYHEVVIQLEGNTVYKGHFNNIGSDTAVVHLRFHEFRNRDGEPSILMEEGQSDIQLEGRKHGWKHDLPEATQERIAIYKAKEEWARTSAQRMEKAMTAGLGEDYHSLYLDRVEPALFDEMRRTLDSERSEPQYEGNYSEMSSQRGKIRVARRAAAKADARGEDALADMLRAYAKRQTALRMETKFRETWASLDNESRSGGRAYDPVPLAAKPKEMEGSRVVKYTSSEAAMTIARDRLIRWAASKGIKNIYWVRGHEQGVRYSKMNDIAEDEQGGGHHDPEPDESFYYQTGSGTWEEGETYPMQPGGFEQMAMKVDEQNAESIPLRLLQMKDTAPQVIESWDNIERLGGELGDNFVRLPSGDGVASGRHARIIEDNGEGGVVQPVDPRWDPGKVEMSYHTGTGDTNESYWQIKITNRLGEVIADGSMDGSALGWSSGQAEVLMGDFLASAKNPHGYGILGTPGGEVASAEHMKGVETTAEILKDMPSFDDELVSMERNQESHLDEDWWNEYLSETRSERAGGGDAETIRDYIDPQKVAVEQAAAKVKRLKADKAPEHEIDAAIAELEARRDNYSNAAHTQGYDVAWPNRFNDRLKPYKKEADYEPVSLEQDVYEGRYGSEGSGIISDYAMLPAWRFKMPEKMLKDVPLDTDPLMQMNPETNIVRGASQWVGGEDGQRFIALTKDANFSTLMHEFVGHATEEMKRRYADYWEPVEQRMGKPLEEWTTADHEKFATWTEQYLYEGRAPSAEMATLMGVMKEWMLAVYQTIRGEPAHWDAIPDETRALLDTFFGKGISTRMGARTYVPHVSVFDNMKSTYGGPVHLPAGGDVIGRTAADKRTFSKGHNRGVLWQSGELALSARPVIDQYFRRVKFTNTRELRRGLYAKGKKVTRLGDPKLQGKWLIRNPDAAPEKIPSRVAASMTMTEKDFARAAADDMQQALGEGENLDEFNTKLAEERIDNIAAPGERPEWTNDLKNVRYLDASQVKHLIDEVYPSGSRSKGAAAVGAANTMSRMAAIYLRPLHYLIGNVPQNVMMVALTNPSALLHSAKYGAYAFLPRIIKDMGVTPHVLAKEHPELYDAIKVETGDIRAGAGLPDFYTRAYGAMQKTEKGMVNASEKVANQLGELADQPYRVSVWIAHAKRYGYNTPGEWEKLLRAEKGSHAARIRDDIAQATREDMIDFNTISPWERQHIGRFFFLWAFTRGFAKWPLTFAREYPGRTGLALTQADPDREVMGVNVGDLPSNAVGRIRMAPGKVRDLGFLDPSAGLREQIQTGSQVAHGNFTGVGGMLTPWAETGIQIATGGPRAPKGGLKGIGGQLAEDLVPGVAVVKRTARGGQSIPERIDSFLEVTDRVRVKSELGKGKNAEKKRQEDKKIASFLGDRDASKGTVEAVTISQDAYWHHKYLTQQIRFGSQARRGGTSLTQKEKLAVLYATAKEFYPDLNLPPREEVELLPEEAQQQVAESLTEAMFGIRNSVMGAAK